MKFSSLMEFFFPRTCPVCGRMLTETEKDLCVSCLMELPYTKIGNTHCNEFEKTFWLEIPICRASTLLYYGRDNATTEILHLMKYDHRRDLCISMGIILANRLKPTGFFQGIDLIVPVPLHPNKLRLRGYNQSELLSQGISHVMGIPLCTAAIIRRVDNPTQTQKSFASRREGPDDLFAASPEACRLLKAKHVLLVDDVLTSGATMIACAKTIADVPDITISILTLAWTR